MTTLESSRFLIIDSNQRRLHFLLLEVISRAMYRNGDQTQLELDGEGWEQNDYERVEAMRQKRVGGIER